MQGITLPEQLHRLVKC